MMVVVAAVPFIFLLPHILPVSATVPGYPDLAADSWSNWACESRNMAIETPRVMKEGRHDGGVGTTDIVNLGFLLP